MCGGAPGPARRGPRTWICGFLAGWDGSGSPHGHLGSYSYARFSDSGEILEASREIWSPYPLYVCESDRVVTDRGGPGCVLLEPGSRVIGRPDGLERSRSPPTAAPPSEDCQIERLVRALTDCHRAIACGPRRVAIAFSGGLDSSLLALLASELCGQEVILYTVTDEGMKGVGDAMESAAALGLPLRDVVVTASRSADFVSAGDYRSDMEAALALGFSSAAEAAREGGVRHLVVGQLADELFGGYHRYLALRGRELDRAMMSDLEGTSVSLVRDASAIMDRGVMPIFPYTCSGLVPVALAMPSDCRVRGGIRKYALRMAAIALGLPERLAMREKRAFQYSSGLERLIRAQRAGRPSRGPGPERT
jgi:Asparagine synthase (glutamine-hydrolyzing)